MSRSELARRAGLSKPVVTEIVDDLLSRGLIVEGAKGVSHQGRKPILLKINRESMWVVGIDLAREHVNVIITDLLGNVVQRRREDVAFDRPEALAAPVPTWSNGWSVSRGFPKDASPASGSALRSP